MDTSDRQTPEIAVTDPRAVQDEMFQSIFTNCDTQNQGEVAPSVVVNFIKPFFQEPHNLENLKQLLDPDNNDAKMNKDKFLQIMSDWSSQLCSDTSPEQEFGSPNSPLSISAMHGHLSYQHSTPRPSIGDKLLKCRELLNISNVSGYSLSTSQLEHQGELDKTVLEEEIKKLEHQLSKTMSELNVLQEQLSTTEELNDKLRSDLVTVTRKLQVEQLINEQLRQNNKQTEDLQDELDSYRKTVADLKRKLAQYERDNINFENVITQLENEKSELEKNVSKLSRENKQTTKELFDVKLECDNMDAQINHFTKLFKDMDSNLKEQKHLNDQLREEVDMLKHQKTSLIKNTKARHSLNLSIEQKEDKGNSSDEDISWRLQQGHGDAEEKDESCTSLRDELPKAKTSTKTVLHSSEETKTFSNLYARKVNLRLTEKCTEQENTIHQLNNQIRTQCNNLIEAQKKIASLNSNVERLQQELSEVKSAKIELEKQAQEMSNARLKIENIDTLVEQVQSHVTEKSANVQDLKRTIEDLKRRLDTNVDCCLSLKNQLSNNVGQKNELWSRAKVLEKDLNEKILEINRLTKSYEELEIKHCNLSVIYQAEVNKRDELSSLVNNAHKSQNHDKDSQTVDVTLDDAELGIGLLDDLKEKYSKEVTENRKLTTVLSQLRDDYARIRTEFEEIKETVGLMKANVIEDLDKAKESLKMTVAEIEQKDLEIEKLNEEVAYVKVKNEEKIYELSQLNLAQTATLDKLKVVKEDNLQLTKEMKEIKLELSKMNEVNNQLNELNVKYESELENLKASKLESVQLIEDLKQELQETCTKINSLDARYQGVVNELEIFKTENLQLTSKLKHTEKKLDETVEKSKKLESQLDEGKSQIAKLKSVSQNAFKEVETAKSENNLLTTKLEDSKLELHQMQAQINKLNKEYQSVLTKLQSAERNMQLTQELKIKLDEATKKDFQLTRLEQELQQQHSNFVLKLEETRTENLRLQNQFCDVKAELDRCWAALQDKDNQIKQLSSTNHELSSELLMVRREKEELDVDCASLNRNITTLKQTNKRLKDKVAEMISNPVTSENQLILQKSLIRELECSLKTCNADLDELKRERGNLKLQLDRLQQVECSLKTCNKDLELIKMERDNLKLELDKLQQVARKHSYSKQEIVIEKLKKRNEELEKRQKEALEEEVKRQVELNSLEKRLGEELARQLRKREVGVDVEVQTLEVELDICECKTVGKFTVVNSKNTENQPLDEEPTSSNIIKRFEDNAQKYTPIDDNVEVPALDISFSGDFIDSLDISGSGKNLSKTELEEKVTAITLFLVTSSGNISKKVEQEIEVYKTKYESLLSLLADISYRLRDHVCIGTPEPIVPVYVMLEEVKLQLKSLVQNASQVGALICEQKMKRCWNPLINYTALLRQGNEKLEKKLRSTDTASASVPKHIQTKSLKSASRRRCHWCWKINAALVLTLTCAVMVGIIMNVTCRLNTPDSHYCPLDDFQIVRRLLNRPPPM